MKIKRYVDTDMRHVLRRVRQDQGPDAVILSNRRVEEGIEVIAAVDYDEALMQQALGSNAALADSHQAETEVDAPPAGSVPVRPEDVVATKLQPVPAGAVPGQTGLASDTASVSRAFGMTESENRVSEAPDFSEDFEDVRHELSALRDLMESQLAHLVWSEGVRQSPLRTQMLRNLARLGIAPDVANSVINRLAPIDDVRQVWRAPLGELAQMIPTTDDTLLTEGGTVALIGPTGVGKTTTIAKIAARYSMTYGSDEIALVCADAYRIGAKEHLTAFGNIIGVKVHAASTADELTELLQRLRSKKLVLIDTEGMSQRDVDLSSRLAAFGVAKEAVKFYLTLSAASQEATLEETVRRFDNVPLAGAIVTKVDEAGQLGCALSVLMRHDLPAAWLSNGQRIPDDLHAAARKRLWLVNQAVECMNLSAPEIDERMLAERYAHASVAHA